MRPRKPQIGAFLRSIAAVLLLACLYNGLRLSNRRNQPSIRRIAEEIQNPQIHARLPPLPDLETCADMLSLESSRSKCDFLLANPNCDSGGLFSYLRFFYCDCGDYTFLGFLLLFSGLVILFYLLGNTAADYFCCSLENLSNLLNLSPTLAGVSLLPFGNGAPDVFSSVAAFLGHGSGGVGLSSVLGGAMFVTCIVVGVISIAVANKGVQIDRKCFVRDVCFFLFAVLCLALILIVGRATIAMAVGFVLVYVLYGVFVALNEVLMRKNPVLRPNEMNPLLPVASGFLRCGPEEDELRASLIRVPDDDEGPRLGSKLPHWVWMTNVVIYSDYLKADLDASPRSVWGWTEESRTSSEGQNDDSLSLWCSRVWSVLEIPMILPRRLTIPVVEEGRWSKPYGVASVFFGPVFLASIWSARENVGLQSCVISYLVALGVGCVLGGLAFVYTKPDHPPRRFLLLWVLAGFLMSIMWFYLIANELVALLVALGTILDINPSLLAITILAWGNSMGDLISNTALALNKRDGVQIAMSGCYAGPMFNTLIGLGVSMILGALKQGSEGYIIPKDVSLFYTIGFLMAGLIWALVVLPSSDMRPNRVLGAGLVTIYLMFLCFRLGTAIGTASQNGL